MDYNIILVSRVNFLYFSGYILKVAIYLLYNNFKGKKVIINNNSVRAPGTLKILLFIFLICFAWRLLFLARFIFIFICKACG